MNQTRKRIMDAYVELMKQKPYHKIKIKEIAETAKIQRSTFYQYFDDSYGLLLELEEELLGGMCFYRREPGRSSQDLSIFPSIISWFYYCIEHRKAIQALFGEYGDSHFEILFREKLCGEINQMMDDDGMPKDRLREYCVELNYGIYSSLVKFAMETAELPLAMTGEELAGLANNWRANAIQIEKKSRLPMEDEGFREIYHLS